MHNWRVNLQVKCISVWPTTYSSTHTTWIRHITQVQVLNCMDKLNSLKFQVKLYY